MKHRLAHRVVRSSQATPAAVDKSQGLTQKFGQPRGACFRPRSDIWPSHRRLDGVRMMFNMAVTRGLSAWFPPQPTVRLRFASGSNKR